MPPKWTPAFVFSGWNSVRISHQSTRATCPIHPILLDFGITLSWDYKLWHLSLCSLLYPFVISFLAGPKMLPRILGCRTNTTNKQDRQSTCTVTLSGVRATTVAVEKQYYILWLCACSLRYPACNAHAPYCHLWPVRAYYIFAHYLINGTNIECVLIFSTNFVWNISNSKRKWAK
jgi:hypothetical protein